MEDRSRDSIESERTAREKEILRAQKAIEEIETVGCTALRCLRCNSNYVFEDYGSAYVIRCETEGCFKITARGL